MVTIVSLKHYSLKLADNLAPGIFAFGKLPSYFYGSWLWLDKSCWKSLYLRYEADTIRVLRENVRKGETFWDVGANYGLMSLLASQIVGEAGDVVAFEPAPESHELLLKNISGHNNITALPYAVGDQDGPILMSVQGASTGSSLVKDVVALSQRYHDQVPVIDVPVQLYRLDTLLNKLQRKPNVIKIDIEGFEVKALRGAQQLLSEVRPTLIIEIHPLQIEMSGTQPDELFDMLKLHGYRYEVYNRDQQWSLYSIVAKP